MRRTRTSRITAAADHHCLGSAFLASLFDNDARSKERRNELGNLGTACAPKERDNREVHLLV